MRTDLALLNILNNKARAALSVAGIGTAILLMFMQMGFRGAVENTATMTYEKMDFDLVVRSPEYLHFVLPGQVRRQVLWDIAAEPEVATVIPFHVSMNSWHCPAKQSLESPGPGAAKKQVRGIVVLGIDPANSPFRQRARVSDDLRRLASEQLILIDQKSFDDYGPQNGRVFSEQDIGVETTVGAKPVTIAGLFELGSGLTANGAMMTNEQGFDRLFPFDSESNVSFGLIRLKAGVSAAERDQLQQRLQQRYLLEEKNEESARGSPRNSWFHQHTSPACEVEILNPQQVEQRELRRWLNETPIGFIFSMGVAISLVVGAAIVYMILSTDVANRIHEYATLKAMGYTNWALALVVLRQAMYLALFSFVPALALSIVLYWVTANLAQIQIGMTGERVVKVLILSLIMCSVSGTLALKKLWRAEPAELF